MGVVSAVELIERKISRNCCVPGRWVTEQPGAIRSAPVLLSWCSAASSITGKKNVGLA